MAVLSDSHDALSNLEWATKMANDNKCEVLLFAGDLVAPPGINVLRKFKGEIHMIWGNNEGEKMKITKLVDLLKIEHHDYWLECEFAGKKIVMHHWPRPIEIAAKSGLFDLAICGHTHEWRLENFENSVLLNPGSICQFSESRPSMAIVDLETMTVIKLVMD